MAGAAAQGQVDDARASALQQDAQRQEVLDKQSAAINAKSQGRFEDFQGDQEKRAKSLGDYLVGKTGQGAAPPANAPTESMPTSENNIVTREQAKQSAKAKAFTDQQGRALGEMRSFGDLLGGISANQARDAGYLNQTLGFKKGWAGVLPYELEAANQEGAGMKLFGDILGGLGSMGLNAGLSRNVAPTVGAAGGTAKAAPSPVANMYSLPTFARADNPYRVY